MLEPLAGRLKWERTYDGIRVVIPARMSWGAIRKLLNDLGVNILVFLSLLAIAAFVAFVEGRSFYAFLNSEGAKSLYFASLGCCCGLVLARMGKGLFGQTVVTLNSALIAIDWNVRIWRSKDLFPTASVHSFRFVEWPNEIPVQNKIQQSEIQFGLANRVHVLGTGTTREEAEALIEKMLEIYPFPEYPLSKSAASVQAAQNATLS